MALKMNRQYKGRKKIGSRVSTQVHPPQINALMVSAVITTTHLAITFDQPVILNGFPADWVTVGGGNQHPISAVLTSPNVVTLAFTSTIAGATDITITQNDPAIRTATGGFAASPTFPLT